MSGSRFGKRGNPGGNPCYLGPAPLSNYSLWLPWPGPLATSRFFPCNIDQFLAPTLSQVRSHFSSCNRILRVHRHLTITGYYQNVTFIGGLVPIFDLGGVSYHVLTRSEANRLSRSNSRFTFPLYLHKNSFSVMMVMMILKQLISSVKFDCDL